MNVSWVIAGGVMAESFFQCPTIDDLMHCVIAEILAHGDKIRPTKGDAIELTGVLLEVASPRARLSLTETRGKLFSCLGELCWYLAKSKDISFIKYYIEKYKDDANGDEISGGYGPRLFEWRGRNQLANVTRVLRSKRDSRNAVIQLYDAEDLERGHRSIPCTTTLQFMLRNGALHMFTCMRSNDVFLGLPHDFFCFTMLQEVLASDLGADLGVYKQAVGSLHLYSKHIDLAEQFLDEGWQPTTDKMPMMPKGDPWPGIKLLLMAESQLRLAGVLSDGILEVVDPYWADLIRLLEILKFKKDKDPDKIKAICGKMASKFYSPFIEKTLSDLT
jgi:thymidylate synthase